MKEPETNFPLHLFHHGTNFKAYETMGILTLGMKMPML